MGTAVQRGSTESIVPAPTERDVAEYVEAMLLEMRDVARSRRLGFLRYLIDMAREEARRVRMACPD